MILTLIPQSYRRTSVATAEVLESYKKMVLDTQTDLQDHLASIEKKVEESALSSVERSDAKADQKELEEERIATENGLALCTEARAHADQVRMHTFEDVSADKNASQVILTTNLGDLISARRMTAGVGATQVLGSISAASFQLVMRDRLAAAVSGTEKR